MELLNVELVVSIRRESYLRVYLIGFADYDDLRTLLDFINICLRVFEVCSRHLCKEFLLIFFNFFVSLLLKFLVKGADFLPSIMFAAWTTISSFINCTSETYINKCFTWILVSVSFLKLASENFLIVFLSLTFAEETFCPF